VLQFTFCSASASSVTGSLAERSTISSVIIFITVYAVVIFPVVHSWVWGDGWLQKQGFIDYSGSGIAYMTGGVCGAVGAVFIGPRHGFCSPLSATEKEIIDRNKKKDNKHKQKTNTQLRDTLEKQNRALEDKEAEVFTLELENQNVRERLELVEGILKSNKTGYDSLLSANVRAQMAESSDHQATTASIDEVYQELIKLRSTNKKLEGRIKQLENQNFRITQSSFGSKAKISKNAEPIRPIFDAELAA